MAPGKSSQTNICFSDHTLLLLSSSLSFPLWACSTKMIRSISLQKHSNFWLTCVNGCFTLCRVSKVQIQIAVGQSAIIRAELAVRPFNLFLPALEGMTLIGEGRAGQATKAWPLREKKTQEEAGLGRLVCRQIDWPWPGRVQTAAALVKLVF
jgi:hypothetical protein